MKAITFVIALLFTNLVFAANPPVRILKPGESHLILSCGNYDPSLPIDSVNAALAGGVIKISHSTGKTVDSIVQIDPPYIVSAPSFSGTGDRQAGYSWCVVVTVTKQ